MSRAIAYECGPKTGNLFDSIQWVGHVAAANASAKLRHLEGVDTGPHSMFQHGAQLYPFHIACQRLICEEVSARRCPRSGVRGTYTNRAQAPAPRLCHAQNCESKRTHRAQVSTGVYRCRPECAAVQLPNLRHRKRAGGLRPDNTVPVHRPHACCTPDNAVSCVMLSKIQLCFDRPVKGTEEKGGCSLGTRLMTDAIA